MTRTEQDLMENKHLVHRTLLRLTIIRMAFCCAVLLFAGVAYFYLQNQQVPQPFVLKIFQIVALGSVIAGYLIRRNSFSENGIDLHLPQFKADPNAISRHYTNYSLICFALFEVAGLCGLVLVVLGFDWMQAMPLFVLGLLALVLIRPTNREFRTIVDYVEARKN